MVRVGAFVLRLVCARTDAELEEHTDDAGNTWVAGSEGDEFFVRVQLAADPGFDVQTVVEVDGASIGYTWNISGDQVDSESNKTSKLGPLKSGQQSSGGTQVTAHAFKFEKIGQPAADNDDNDDDSQPASGQVVARWHRAVKSGQPALNTGVQTWQGAGATAAAGGDKARKKEGASALKSGTGATPTSYTWSQYMWEQHEEVARATIRYTSEFGLAVRGILKDDQGGAPRASGLPRAKQGRARGGGGGSSSAAGSSVVDIDDDDEKPAKRRGFTHGEVVQLSDSD